MNLCQGQRNRNGMEWGRRIGLTENEAPRVRHRRYRELGTHRILALRNACVIDRTMDGQPSEQATGRRSVARSHAASAVAVVSLVVVLVVVVPFSVRQRHRPSSESFSVFPRGEHFSPSGSGLPFPPSISRMSPLRAGPFPPSPHVADTRISPELPLCLFQGF